MNDPGAPADAGPPPGRVPVSIVVPTLDEGALVDRLVGSLARQPDGVRFEVILADGGSRDGTPVRFATLARAAWPDGRARVVACTTPGRARQMNAGAAAATGDALLFLHADTLLPPGAPAMVADALARGAVGGGFALRFDEPDQRLALIARWATLRSRLTGIHYGDQSQFIRRDLFERLGGFPDLPLFEDRRLSELLRGAGRVVTLNPPVRTSGRRFLQGGVARTSMRFAWLKLRYALGADPAALAREYHDAR